ncbi:MAG: SDR family NAD(P)-dependent oxidoreductase, partial [Actinomycetota bacterium]
MTTSASSAASHGSAGSAGPAGAGGTGRTALVTGASRGIGKSCAQFLARAGFDVAISARTVTPGEA